MLFVLSGAVGVILLVGCASAANLLLARAGERRREFAVRSAIGAGRGRLTRQLLTEGVLLSTIAGGIGVMLAHWSVGAIVAIGGNTIPRQGEIAIDWRVLLFSGLVTVATGVLFALAPAVRASRIDLARDMQDTANAAGASPGLQRLRSVLVVGEMTLSVVLLIGGALLAQSLWRLGRADLGFDGSRVTSFDVSLPTARYGEFALVERFFDDLTEELASLPGVVRVAAVDRAPLASGTWTDGFAIGTGEPEPGDGPMADFRRATVGYFEALGIPLQAGRTIRSTDRHESPPVVVVNRVLVDRYFDGQDPVGQVITTFGGTREIVGVVGTVRHRALEQDGMPTMYFPWRQMEWQAATVLLQTGVGAAPGAAAIRQRVRAIDPQLPISGLTTMADRVSGALTLPRFRTGVIGGLSSLALLLSVFGVYSVVSYSVMLRSREIGIRVALGSGRGAVRWLVARQGLVLAGLAAVLGTGVAFGLSQVLEAFLYGVARSDLRTFVLVPMAVLGIGFLASLVPAIRASRADPVIVLRQ
jgi:predicted permease